MTRVEASGVSRLSNDGKAQRERLIVCRRASMPARNCWCKARGAVRCAHEGTDRRQARLSDRGSFQPFNAEVIMKTAIAIVLAALALSAASPSDAKGCIKGAIVGGAAGHFAGHHGALGAAAGCLYGHHRAKEQEKQQEQQKQGSKM
jgi:hypothetical protein